MPSLQTLNMLNISLIGDGKACSFKPAHAELHSIQRHYLSGLFANVVDKFREAKNARWDFSFELRPSNKNYG